jgi:toxin ParE1/3/4
MSWSLIIREEAEADLADAKQWYDQQRAGLGDQFLLCVDAALERIRRMPEVHAVLLKGVRRALVRRFPYGIFYRVEQDYISILAVMHNRRDPRRWQSRA